MKAIAAIAIAQSFSKQETAAAGLFVGATVTVFSLAGLLRWFGRVVPVPVVRGIQVGAGLSLVISAGSSLLQPLGWDRPWADNRIWATGAFIFLLLASLIPRMPYALAVFVLGLVLSAIQLAPSHHDYTHGSALWRPSFHVPNGHAWRKGAIDAGLPQLPLTTLNSILAVTSLSASLFPSYPPAPSTTSLGLSVGLANLIACWFGAMPVCHGSGGLAGQYRFGARSGASVVVLGLLKLLLGLFAGERIVPLLQRFPHGLLGIMVLAAGVELAKVGQSLDADLWEETERENTGNGADGAEIGTGARDKRSRLDERERRDRWMVMLVTVAGCLAFKNDAVGFLAGMVWHCGLRIPELGQRSIGQRGRRSGFWRWLNERGRGEEREGLLEGNFDAPEARLA